MKYVTTFHHAMLELKRKKKEKSKLVELWLWARTLMHERERILFCMFFSHLIEYLNSRTLSHAPYPLLDEL